jgi:predicted dipeptidase
MRSDVVAALSVVLCSMTMLSCRYESAVSSSAVPEPVSVERSAAQPVRDLYDSGLRGRVVPLLTEVVGFATYEGNDAAHAAQKAWLESIADELGFEFRDGGAMYDVTLPGPENAPVLGLLVHGDVVEVEESKWSFPPFDATVVDGMIQGRGVADDKGPLVQALLAMKALAESEMERHATIRLIVGTAEESTGEDIQAYLEESPAPDLSLVLDSDFPLNVGEKAWNALYVYAPMDAPQRGDQSWIVEDLRAGLATSIVPDEAVATLLWTEGEPDWSALEARLRAKAMPEGTSLDLSLDGRRVTIRVAGIAAHAGDNLRNGRNALVALAGLLEDELPDGSPSRLLRFAKMAGKDLSGGGLGIEQSDSVWGTYDVNVATILPDEDDPSKYRLAINVRRIPPWTQDDLKAHLAGVVEALNRENGTELQFDGWWDSEPLIIELDSPAVQRLLASYRRVTGDDAVPGVSAGGTYAKRTPRAIAFGMWLPGLPYPGHGVDEKVSIESLHLGTHVLIEALVDLACSGEPLPVLVRHGAAVED